MELKETTGTERRERVGAGSQWAPAVKTLAAKIYLSTYTFYA
jgi:hypothetical protein